MFHIFVVSDGTGGTAQQTLRAALTQFPDVDVDINLRSDVRREEQILRIIQEAVRANGIIVHTFVSFELRNLIVRYSKMQNVTTVDLMGPLLDRLSYHFADAPSQKPGLFHKLNEAYFKRIEAMEFAIQHDDGQRVNELWQAEIILVGISRTFKTPLSIYLAFKGWFVANVPIVLDVEIPEILSHVSPERVVALITDPIRLAALRKVRQKYLKNATGNYADPEHVRREVRYAMRIFNRFPRWRRILVTNKPIEEISSEILISIADQEM